MAVLTPQSSARIAAAVYEVETSKRLEKELAGRNPFGLSDLFELADLSITRGKSGPTMLPSLLTESGFGYVAKGKGSFAGDVLVAFRGTNFLRGRDIWTDANFSTQRGPSGHTVHGGFNDGFKSIVTQLKQQLQGLNPTRLHLVGHSLGGALATLAADWCVSNGAAQCHVYTFGSPRVGMQSFAGAFTEQLQAANIYRVYHTSDVVSMVPLYSFMHAPLPGVGCAVARDGWLYSPMAISTHLMGSYIFDLAGASWETLKTTSAVLASQRLTRDALQRAAVTRAAGYLSAKVLYAISDTLQALMTEAGQMLGVGMMGSMTVFDRMVYALDKLAQSGKNQAVKVGQVIDLSLSFMGNLTTRITRLSAVIIRQVLTALFNMVYMMARRALEAVQ